MEELELSNGDSPFQHKPESSLLGKISITSDMQIT